MPSRELASTMHFISTSRCKLAWILFPSPLMEVYHRHLHRTMHLLTRSRFWICLCCCSLCCRKLYKFDLALLKWQIQQRGTSNRQGTFALFHLELACQNYPKVMASLDILVSFLKALPKPLHSMVFFLHILDLTMIWKFHLLKILDLSISRILPWHHYKSWVCSTIL